jgi:DNA polymerase III alpha subunit (gram-positive type)
MIRILLFATIVLSLASGALAYLTRQRAQEMSGNLKVTSQSVTESKSAASKLKEENKTAQARIEELAKSADSQKAQADQVAANLKETESKATKLEADLAEKSKKVEALNRQLQEAVAAAKPPVPMPDPAQEAKMAEMGRELERLKQESEKERKRLADEAAELKKKVTQLTAKNSSSGSAAGSVGAVGGRGGGAPKVVSGTVVAFNEGWNFVVVDLGDKNGVTPETPLAVQRNGKFVANLKVTEVRPKHVSADVEYPEGKRRERVLLGDTVVVVPKPLEPPTGESALPNDLFASPTAVP